MNNADIKLFLLNEVSYEGNMGFHEMFQFYGKATDKEIDTLEYLISKKLFKKAWELVQRVTGVKLKGKEFALESFLPGGLGDNLSLNDIARLHRVTLERVKHCLKIGIKVELEHTSNKRLAAEIAKDHLVEDIDYYINLQKIEEKLPTNKIDYTQFPNPTKNKDFLDKGLLDGEVEDDKIKNKLVSIPAIKLKPSQEDIYLGKTIGSAIDKAYTGDAGIVISKEYYILDGHHRFAAAMLDNPNAKIKGLIVDLSIGDLIPVLRSVGDALNNPRGQTPPKGHDISVYKATIQDIKESVHTGKGIPVKFYDKEKAIKWLNSINEDTLIQRLAILQKKLPPPNAPERKEMPKINKNQINLLRKLLNSGKIDVVAPYKK